jgi:hypothetical protein
MQRLIAALALGFAAVPLAAQDPSPLPGFLLGAWVERKGEARAEESWSGDVSGLHGTSRTGSGDRVESEESLTIARRDGTLVLIAQPRGAGPVPFRMLSHDEHAIVFANPAHDYPQRIRYWREGDMLHAEIALIDGSEAVAWSYVRRGE